MVTNIDSIENTVLADLETEQAIQTIEISIETARKTVATGKVLDRLIANKDFDEIITEGYFVQEASRLVLMKATPGVEDAEHQEQILKAIDAIGHLRQHFIVIKQMARLAERSILADEDTRDELLAEAV